MALNFTPTELSGPMNTSFITELNNNFTDLQTLLDDVLSRIGTNPNTWESDQDANSNDLNNLGRLHAAIVDTDELLVGGNPLPDYSDIQAILDVIAAGIYTKDELDGGVLDGLYYRESEVDALLAANAAASDLADAGLQTQIDSLSTNKSDVGHIHDDRYYTESEVDVFLGTKADVGHTHPEYATSAAVNLALDSKSDVGHTHVKADITDFSDADYATAAQGALADTAVQPGDNVSDLVNDAGYLTTVDGDDLTSIGAASGDIIIADGVNGATWIASSTWITNTVEAATGLTLDNPTVTGTLDINSGTFPIVATTSGADIAINAYSTSLGGVQLAGVSGVGYLRSLNTSGVVINDRIRFGTDVGLFYNGVEKLTTTASGVNITGQATQAQQSGSGLLVASAAASTPHPFTSILAANTYFSKFIPAGGGIVDLACASSDIAAWQLTGYSQAPSTTGTNGVFKFIGRKSDGGTGFTNLGTTDDLFNITNNGSSRALLKGNGDLILAGQLSATGISFDGGTNVMDVYESGTWTPTLQDNSLSNAEGQTYSTQVGTYEKIGNVVIAQGTVAATSLGTLTGTDNLRIAGLPFASAAVVNSFGNLNINTAAGLALPAAGQPVTGTVSFSSTSVRLRKFSTTSGTTDLLVSEATSTVTFSFCAMYITA